MKRIECRYTPGAAASICDFCRKNAECRYKALGINTPCTACTEFEKRETPDGTAKTSA